MKYTIEGFSQEVALSMRATITENGRAKTIKLDCTDLIILRWIVDFFPQMKKTIINGTEYAWVSYDSLLEDLPLLDLGKRALSDRLRKMETLGILKHETVRTKGTYSYYGFGPEYSRLTGSHRDTAQAPAQDPWFDTTNANTEQFQTPTAEPQPSIAEPEPKPQPKKTRKAKSFDDIIDAYTNDPETKDLLGAWLQNRKAKRSAMTDRAIQGNINKLDQYAQASHMSVNDYLNEVICRGWGSFFIIDDYKRTRYQQKPRQQSQQPHWDFTEEELRRQKEADDEWLKNCVF